MKLASLPWRVDVRTGVPNGRSPVGWLADHEREAFTRMSLITIPGLALVLLFLTLLTSCGYQASTSGRSSHLPASVNTIYVPAFVNKTASYNTDHLLTASVVRELEERTKYRVVLQEDADADATLIGTVLSQQTSPLTYDSQTGRASSALIVVTMSVKLVDRHDHVLYQNPNYTFREQYQVSRELSSFFEEESPALDRLARDFGRELVADILEAF